VEPVGGGHCGAGQVDGHDESELGGILGSFPAVVVALGDTGENVEPTGEDLQVSNQILNLVHRITPVICCIETKE
jgi:hypothetical protein